VPRPFLTILGLGFVLLTGAGLVALNHYRGLLPESVAVAENNGSRSSGDKGVNGPSDGSPDKTPKPATTVEPDKTPPATQPTGPGPVPVPDKDKTPPVTKPDPPVIKPDPPVIKPDPPVTKPDPPNIKPDPPQVPLVDSPKAAAIDLAKLFVQFPPKGSSPGVPPLKSGGPPPILKIDSAKAPPIDLALLFKYGTPLKAIGPLDSPAKDVDPPKTPTPVDPPKTPTDVTKPPKDVTTPPKNVTPPSSDKTVRANYPISFEKIKSTLAELAKPPAGLDGLAAERQAALQKIKAYRFMCGLPYQHLQLDDQLNEYTEAAAKICAALKGLTHNPSNPGWPEAEYKKAQIGCQKSNLAVMFPLASLVTSVDMWMDDSDGMNIGLLGHRRWILNPHMSKTGLGKAGAFSAMWTLDFSFKAPASDMYCYPPRGFTPMGYFSAKAAWCTILNPNTYQIPSDAALDVKVFPIDLQGKKTGPALPLNHKSVSRTFNGTPLCVIFRPDKSAVAVGKLYLVEISGVTLKGAGPMDISYPVEFVSLAAGPTK
jgi:hypothetical protein